MVKRRARLKEQLTRRRLQGAISLLFGFALLLEYVHLSFSFLAAFNEPESPRGLQLPPKHNLRVDKAEQSTSASAEDSILFNRHNPFEKFKHWTGVVKPHMNYRHESLFLGVQTNCTFWGTGNCAKKNNNVRTFPYPIKQDDHFFEWSDLISSLLYAPNERFHMLELGAGWAKWITDAALMGRQLKKQVKAVGVEAQPNHCTMSEWHMKTNRIGPDEVRMIYAAVGERDGKLEFPADTSGRAFRGNGGFGWGIQMILDGKEAETDAVVTMPAYGMCSLLKLDDFGGDPVDFVSLDVQSFEHTILNEEAISCMNELT